MLSRNAVSLAEQHCFTERGEEEGGVGGRYHEGEECGGTGLRGVRYANAEGRVDERRAATND